MASAAAGGGCEGMMGRICKVVAFAGMLALISMSAASAVEIVNVRIGYAATVKLGKKVNTVAVGDLGIADASVAFGDTIVVIGKAPGETNIIPLDDKGLEMPGYLVRVAFPPPPPRIGRPVEVFSGDARAVYNCVQTACVPASPADAIPPPAPRRVQDMIEAETIRNTGRPVQ